MATLGEQLRTAREAKGLTQAEAGDATNILTKVIAALEDDDFSDIAAPTYAKGFIRLYAGSLGLDPVPFIQEYLEKNPAKPRLLLDQDSQRQQNTHPGVGDKAGSLQRGASGVWNALPGKAWKDVRIIGAGIAAIVVLSVLVTSVATCTQRRAAAQPPPLAVATERSLHNEPLTELYIVEPGTLESNP
jgi:cytoskeletal protein RodZ